MIYEFALDPGVLNNWEQFRYLTEKFGVSQGRLISRYPKRWKALVYESLSDAREMEKKRIVERLQSIDRKMQTRDNEWDDEKNWFLNAECEHARKPFHAIITRENTKQRDWVLPFEDLNEETPLWAIQRERVIARDAASLAAAVSPLLCVAKWVIFIDPNFGPYKPRARNTLKAFLEACLTGRTGRALERVEFHTEFKPEVQDFSGECQRQFPQRIPIGMSLRIVRWRERVGGDGLHNRYILTDRGGVRLAWGLDEGNPTQTDDISLLDQGLYESRLSQYCSQQPAFDLVDELVVFGTRRLF